MHIDGRLGRFLVHPNAACRLEAERRDLLSDYFHSVDQRHLNLGGVSDPCHQVEFEIAIDRDGKLLPHRAMGLAGLFNDIEVFEDDFPVEPHVKHPQARPVDGQGRKTEPHGVGPLAVSRSRHRNDAFL